MKDKRWFTLLLFIPILLGVAAINYFVDPAAVYHSDSKVMAEALLEGNKVYFNAGNGDEREMKRYLIMGMPQRTECVTVGPSVAFGINADMVGTKSYYNLGVSSGDFYDILAQLGLMEIYGKQYDRLIFCVDSYFFDGTYLNTFAQNKALKPYAEYMLGILDGKNMTIPDEDAFARVKKQLSQLLSVSYFQASVNWVGTRGVKAALERVKADKDWGIVEDYAHYKGTYYAEDGSLVQALAFQQSTVEDVRAHAEQYDIEMIFSKNGHISFFSEEVFEKMILYLQNKGVEVELFLSPMAPSLWDRIDGGEYYILDEVEGFANEMAEKYSLKITGSYNPYQLNMTDAGFYDGRHVRQEALETFFDFSEKQ